MARGRGENEQIVESGHAGSRCQIVAGAAGELANRGRAISTGAPIMQSSPTAEQTRDMAQCYLACIRGRLAPSPASI